ncbi:MAG: hypothetical protein ACMXYB_02905 [Candidatus Woesearchaeota archaeon]
MVPFNVKNLNNLTDIGLIKWSSIMFTLFVISLWPTFTNLVVGVHWSWFLIISLLLAIKPMVSVFKK